MRKVFISIVLALSAGSLFAQPVPGVDENIPYLQTFGKDSSIEWGDDDFNEKEAIRAIKNGFKYTPYIQFEFHNQSNN